MATHKLTKAELKKKAAAIKLRHERAAVRDAAIEAARIEHEQTAKDAAELELALQDEVTREAERTLEAPTQAEKQDGISSVWWLVGIPVALLVAYCIFR